MTNQTKYLCSIILIAGTIDIFFAFLESYLLNNIKPEIVLKFITSGLIGVKAFEPNKLYIILGLLLHYAITTIVALIYFKTNVFSQFKINRKYASGIIYGLCVWLIMNIIVMPLSNTPALNRSMIEIAISIMIQIVAVGFPIALGYAKCKNHQLSNEYD